MQAVITNVKEQLVEWTIGFYDALKKHQSEMNTTLKADLISILMAGFHTPSDVPETDMKTCVLTVGRPLGSPMDARHLAT